MEVRIAACVVCVLTVIFCTGLDRPPSVPLGRKAGYKSCPSSVGSQWWMCCQASAKSLPSWTFPTESPAEQSCHLACVGGTQQHSQPVPVDPQPLQWSSPSWFCRGAEQRCPDPVATPRGDTLAPCAGQVQPLQWLLCAHIYSEVMLLPCISCVSV